MDYLIETFHFVEAQINSFSLFGIDAFRLAAVCYALLLLLFGQSFIITFTLNEAFRHGGRDILMSLLRRRRARRSRGGEKREVFKQHRRRRLLEKLSTSMIAIANCPWQGVLLWGCHWGRNFIAPMCF